MGTGVGAALVGTAAVGAIVGGLAGKGVAEMVDPTAEDAYWREHYKDRTYAADGSSYDDYTGRLGPRRQVKRAPPSVSTRLR